MSSFINSLVQGTNDKVEIKSNVNLGGQAYQVFKQFKESIEPQDIALIVKSKNIAGDVGIWNNTSLGIWGTSKWGDTATEGFILGSTLAGVLGTSKLGSTGAEFETIRVVVPNDTFVENFLGETFINDDSTVTLDGGAIF